MGKLKILTNELLEELIDAHREQYHSELQSFDAYKAQMLEKLTFAAESYQTAVKEGYRTLLEELRHNPVSSRPHEEFIIKTGGSGKSVQEKVGISYDVITEMYAVVSRLFDEKRHDDARNILSFLLFLNPEIITFWIAMGRVFELEGNCDAALESYKMAIFMDPDSQEGYQNVVRCCVKQKHWDEAIKILDIGLESLEEASDREETKELQLYLNKLKRLVKQKRGVQ